LVFCLLSRIFAAKIDINVKLIAMKKVILAASLSFLCMSLTAQQTANDYIVKTKGAKKTAVSNDASNGGVEGADGEGEKAHDFISDNFRFYSLCDWKEDMKFMVMPEKYDMVVKTFRDASTGKEVSSVSLRHKIMLYKGHSVGSDGHAHVNFLCQDNNKSYYYEIPNGSFDDYCYTKMGVPTLAYLGDVDIAREKILGKTMFLKTKTYYVDTEYDGDGVQERTLEPNEEVKVTAIGVGTRSFPVKIIFEDKKGNEYFQNVAISKTNSGMRDDEFIMDKAKHLFAGSFELQDAIMAVSKDLAQYIGKVVHTKYTTNMLSKGDGKERNLKVPRMTTFTIENLLPKNNSSYVTITLKESESQRIYFKDVTFTNVDNVTGDIDGRREDFFGYLFAMGEGKVRKQSQAVRTAIRQGRVILGMNEDEVAMAMGEPNQTAESSNGRHDWIYNRSNGKLLIVHFGRTGKVVGTNVDRSKSNNRRTNKKTKGNKK